MRSTVTRGVRRAPIRVKPFGLGRIPGHPTRYQLAQNLLAERDPKLLKMRFNKVNTKDVVQAMLLAPVSQDSKGRIMKVKKSERNKNFPAHHATHFTDNVDLHMLSCGTDIINAGVDWSNMLVV
jgi:hypothetical protein